MDYLERLREDYNIQSDDNSVWEETPVSSTEFFEKFLGESLFPLQQDFMDNMMGSDPLTWDTKYQEGIALWGKGTLLGDTEFITAGGKRATIKELTLEDKPVKVFSLNRESGKIDIEESDAPFKKDEQEECAKLTTSFGHSVGAGLYHKFLTLDGWKELKDLKVGDFIASPQHIPIIEKYYVPVKLARWVGYVLGDGCLSSDHRIMFFASKPEIIHNYCSIVESFGGFPRVQNHNTPQSYEISFKFNGRGTNKLIGYAKQLGIYGHTASTKRIPVKLLFSSEESRKALIEGLYATDGWISKHSKKYGWEIGYVAKNKEFITDLDFALKSFGISGKIRERRVKYKGQYCSYWQLTITDKSEIQKFCSIFIIPGKQDSQEQALQYANSLSRIGTKLSPLVSKTIASGHTLGYGQNYSISKRNRGIGVDTLRAYDNRELVWEKITKIEFLGLQDVYTASVPTTENYYCAGLLHHNSGKDKTAAKFLIYVVYLLLCMRNPQSFLGLGVGDKIELVNVSINAQLAQAVFFKYFVALIKKTTNPNTGKKWFVEKGLNFAEDIKKKEVTFPKGITAYSLNSEEYTAEGMNVLIAIFDEIAGFEVKSADQLYKALHSSALSRFPKHMKILLLSYKRGDNDYMMTRFTMSEKEPNVFRHGPFATWEVNLNRKESDFAQAFVSDPETSERMYKCTGNTSEGGFIKHKSRISQVINASLAENPIVGDIVSTSDLRSLKFKDFFKPIPLVEYFIHVDLAKGQEGGDLCGFSMCHYDKNMTVNVPDGYIDGLLEEHPTLKREDLMAQIGKKKVGVVLDLILQIKAPATNEIMFDEIRALIERLRKIEKFPIYKVTYDQFQSFDSIALLKKAGVNADEQSVDKDNRAYNTLKNLIYEGLVKSYYHPILIRELEELAITKTGKVDHPEKSSTRYMNEDKINRGSKDVSDSVAGAVALAVDRGKGGFSFGASGGGKFQPPQPTGKSETPRLPQTWESEKPVRYGERVPMPRKPQ